jgi:hypothetical protein
MDLRIRESPRRVTAGGAHGLEFLRDIGSEQLLLVRPAVQSPERFKPAVDGRRLESLNFDESVTTITL